MKLAAVLASLVSAAAALGQVAEPVIIAPQSHNAVIWDRRPRPVQPVRLTNIAATVEIADQVASTTLELTLSNSGGVMQEAQLLIPVPDGVTVRSFQLSSLGEEPTAKLLPRDEARRIYDSIVAKMRDPGLLEFAGSSVIRSSVFPVPPNGTNTVRLTYDALLPADGERVDYVLPRSECLAGGVPWTMGLTIKSKRAISAVYSPSHDIVTERIAPGHVKVRVTGESASQPGSLRLSYLLERAGQDGVCATFLAYPDPDVASGRGGYFMLLAGLPAGAGDDARKVRREVTIVLDRSGSMRGEKIEQAREAALQVVEGLAHGEYFNIIDYSDSIASFAEQPVAKDDKSIAEARAYIAAIKPGGGTNIHDALIEALRQDATPGTLPVVLFLTDGLPTVGQTGEVVIREAAAKANKAGRRIFSFGVGLDVNAPLLGAIAKSSRAVSTFVLPGEDVEVKVGQVYKRLTGPVFDSPRITAIGADGKPDPRAVRELQPALLPDVFEGDQIVLLAQYTGEAPVRLRLEGNYLGTPRTFDLAFDSAKASARHGFVPRLWAGRKIGALIDEIRQAGADSPSENPRTKELVDEIVRLSIKFGILTEYTAFLATEPGFEGRAPTPAAEAQSHAHDNIRERVARRKGGGGINQSMNIQEMERRQSVAGYRGYVDKDLKKVEVQGVQQIGDRTLLRRGSRWVDADMLDKENEAPDQTIEFASAEYGRLVDDLVAQNRQGLLAVEGDVYLLNRGQRILVKAPTN